MSNKTKYLAVLFAIALTPPQDILGQDGKKFPHLRLGLDAGYFQPFGEWTEHRYALGAGLFGGSATFRGEVELRMRKWGIALNAGYTNLNTGAWEDYARARGDAIDASASLVQFGLLLKPYLKTRRPHIVKLELGLIYSLLNGEERFAGRRFDYDFMKSGFGFMAGVGYDRYLSQSTALTLRAGGVFVPGGVQYADGVKYGLNGMPVTVGIRFDVGGASVGKSLGSGR
jgi:hypothetical protein